MKVVLHHQLNILSAELKKVAMASVDSFECAKSAMRSAWSDCIIRLDEFPPLPHRNKKVATGFKNFLGLEQNLLPYISGCAEKCMKEASTPNSGSTKKLVYGVQNRKSIYSENSSSFNHLPKNISESAEISCTDEELVAQLSCVLNLALILLMMQLMFFR
jgi:hypothetical protein